MTPRTKNLICGAFVALTTLITFIATVLMRFKVAGWITVLMIWFPLRPILFLIAGFAFAASRRKAAAGYVLFALLCASSILYALFFEDVGDTGSTSKLVSFANATISFGFLLANGILSIVLIIYSVVKSSKHPATPPTGLVPPTGTTPTTGAVPPVETTPTTGVNQS